MVGKKLFFIKSLLKSDKFKDEVSFDKFLNCYSKDKLSEFINSTIHNERTNEKNLSMILFKINWLNDGGDFKDEAMKRVFDTVRMEVREFDIIAKWDENSFVLILPECSYESAGKIGLLIKSIVESKKFLSFKISLDYGITEHKENDTHESFFERANENLVEA